MKSYLFLIVSCLFATATVAQETRIAAGCRQENNGQLLVQLKFLFPDKIISAYAVNVFRKPATGGNWEKLTPAPVTKASLTEPGGTDMYRYYKGYMTRKPSANAENENNAQAMAGLLIVDNK